MARLRHNIVDDCFATSAIEAVMPREQRAYRLMRSRPRERAVAYAADVSATTVSAHRPLPRMRCILIDVVF